MIKVLFIDDEEDILEFYSVYFNNDKTIKGIYINSAIVGLNKSLVEEIDVVVTDLHMPHMSGNELIRRLNLVIPDTPIIIVSASTKRPEGVVYARFFDKALDIKELRIAILEEGIGRKC